MPATIGSPLSGCLPTSRGSDSRPMARVRSTSAGDTPRGREARFGLSFGFSFALALRFFFAGLPSADGASTGGGSAGASSAGTAPLLASPNWT